MTQVRDTIHVNVEYFDGQEEGDVGYPYFVASCEEIAATTDAITLDELFKNIREMIEVHLEDPETVAAGDLAPNPHIIITMELPTYA
jgi:predicted RNase H-like HicB family nuclease